MNLQDFKLRRQQMIEDQPKYRQLCPACIQPGFGCYCQYVQKFDAKIKFVILIHPIEVRRRIATGRMSHLCLQNSELIAGQDYTHHPRVNQILKDPQLHPLILYPGRQSLNISHNSAAPTSIFTAGKTPTLFVIDGTWATARKTMYQSQNLKQVPRICFTPPKASQFRVRKQPAPEAYSTIEAIHHSIELLGSQVGFNVQERQHDKLLYVFNKMVERQLEFIRQAQSNPDLCSYRKPQFKVI